MEKKTLYDLKSFKEFLTSEDERRELQEISAAKLTRCRNSVYFIIKYTFKHLKKYILFVLQVYFQYTVEEALPMDTHPVNLHVKITNLLWAVV